MKKSFGTLFLVAVFLLITVSTSVAFAKEGDTRPGWGFGDKNHVHTGPPGLSDRPVNVAQDNHVNLSQIFKIDGDGNVWIKVSNFIGHNIFHWS